MSNWTRRSFILSAGAGMTAACAGGTESTQRNKIDRNVEFAVQQMHAELPFTQQLSDDAAGMLVMPTITKAGLIIGGTYGEGSLLIGNAPVDYYNVAGASYGLQAGAQQYSSVLFFMDSEHLQSFRARNGWTLGADVEYTIVDNSGAAGIDNNTIKDAVYSVVFNQAGLLAGISVEGSKYSRVVR